MGGVEGGRGGGREGDDLKHLFVDKGWTPNENGKFNSAHVRQTSHAAV